MNGGAARGARRWRGMGSGDGGVCGFWRRLSGPEERRLLELLAYGLVALGAASALLLRFVPMPYGRYSSPRFGWPLPARPAWALQELPSLLVPLGLAACGGAAAAAWPNRLLLGCFVVHYAHRCGPGDRRSDGDGGAGPREAGDNRVGAAGDRFRRRGPALCCECTSIAYRSKRSRLRRSHFAGRRAAFSRERSSAGGSARALRGAQRGAAAENGTKRERLALSARSRVCTL